jgi:hypothetical protein
MLQLSIRVPEETVEQIDRLLRLRNAGRKHQKGLTRSDVARELFEVGLKAALKAAAR